MVSHADPSRHIVRTQPTSNPTPNPNPSPTPTPNLYQLHFPSRDTPVFGCASFYPGAKDNPNRSVCTTLILTLTLALIRTLTLTLTFHPNPDPDPHPHPHPKPDPYPGGLALALTSDLSLAKTNNGCVVRRVLI